MENIKTGSIVQLNAKAGSLMGLILQVDDVDDEFVYGSCQIPLRNGSIKTVFVNVKMEECHFIGNAVMFENFHFKV
jgi:hypothetical protein